MAFMPQRIQVRLRGIVQGVGFRPFVYNLAQRLKLAGWVLNDSSGLIAEVEGAGGWGLFFSSAAGAGGGGGWVLFSPGGQGGGGGGGGAGLGFPPGPRGG